MFSEFEPAQYFPAGVSASFVVLRNFALHLQFTGAEGRRNAMESSADHDTRMLARGRRAARILVVDDEDHVRSMIGVDPRAPGVRCTTGRLGPRGSRTPRSKHLRPGAHRHRDAGRERDLPSRPHPRHSAHRAGGDGDGHPRHQRGHRFDAPRRVRLPAEAIRARAPGGHRGARPGASPGAAGQPQLPPEPGAGGARAHRDAAPGHGRPGALL